MVKVKLFRVSDVSKILISSAGFEDKNSRSYNTLTKP
jgi:hypothetical protein